MVLEVLAASRKFFDDAFFFVYFLQYLIQSYGQNTPSFHVLDYFVKACEGRIFYFFFPLVLLQ